MTSTANIALWLAVMEAESESWMAAGNTAEEAKRYLHRRWQMTEGTEKTSLAKLDDTYNIKCYPLKAGYTYKSGLLADVIHGDVQLFLRCGGADLKTEEGYYCVNCNSPKDIDKAFIIQWAPQYDQFWKDEVQYKELVNDLADCKQKNIPMPVDLFERVLRWKSRRLVGIVRHSEWKNICEKIHSIITTTNRDKLGKIIQIYGIAVPTGSTILHLYFPEDYPIMDRRTMEVLKAFSLIDFAPQNPSLNNYKTFRARMLSTLRSLENVSLRELDRALMAFHKANF
jgi:thermostable 8-oxoguanine DNA glycosylase